MLENVRGQHRPKGLPGAASFLRNLTNMEDLKMKRLIALTGGSYLIVVLSVFSVSGQAWAQEDHIHDSPHGGEVRTMGDHHVEFLVVEGKEDKGSIVIFLLDDDFNPAPVDKVEGVVYLTLPDKTKQTLTLAATMEMPKGDHHEEGEHEEGEMHQDVAHLQAEVNLKGVDAFDAVVSLTRGGKRTNLRYRYVKEEHEHDEGDHDREEI